MLYKMTVLEGHICVIHTVCTQNIALILYNSSKHVNVQQNGQKNYRPKYTLTEGSVGRGCMHEFLDRFQPNEHSVVTSLIHWPSNLLYIRARI